MEITIELLYWTLVGCALLIVVLQSISIIKKNKIQRGLLDGSSMVKESFDDIKMLIVAQKNEQNDMLTNSMALLQNVIVESRESIEMLCGDVKAQQAEIIVSQETRFDSSSNKQSQLFELITSSDSDLKGMLSGLQILFTDQHSVTDKILAKVQDKQVNTANQLAEHTRELRGDMSALQVLVIKQHSETNSAFLDIAQAQMDSSEFIVKKQSDEFQHIQKLLGQSHSNLKDLLITLKQLTEKSEFTNRQERIAQLEQLTTQIQKLRADNLVSLINELAKHQELTLETDDFLKKLGDCKVTQIEDKHSGQITQVYYENGIKRSSDTYAGDNLRYQMLFNEDGKPVKGSEFDDQGNLIFEYIYDDAGEISKRIETTYDQSGKKSVELETAY
jgi:hypothetical protein